MGRYNPWKHIGETFPHVIVCTAYELPTGVRGLVKGDRIWLCSSLDRIERRCTLAHEIAHLERGIVHSARDSDETRAEERAVNMIAAARLVDPVRFIGLSRKGWAEADIATELDVTQRMLSFVVTPDR